MLPLSSPTKPNGGFRRDSFSSNKQKWKFLRRMYKYKHMDFEFAAWQMLYLFIAPSKVYKNFRYHSETKHQWARDDPAFLVLVAAVVVVSSVIYTIILKYSFVQFIFHLLWVFFFDYIAMSLIIATAFWYCVNRFMRRSNSGDQWVEWQYSLDVHLNALLPFLVILHIVQVIFMHKSWEEFTFVIVLSNALWLVAVTYYFYITFLGYFVLPFTEKTTAFLYPIAAFAVLFLLAVALRWHFSYPLRLFVTYRVTSSQ